ncbi:MAG: ABC transporter substrate-binding protein [Acidimicrobiia bacterium]|nr:ABC transporter substrate-binding protein [Acidimicrobiia bacterium]
MLLALALVVAACGAGDDDDETEGTQATTADGTTETTGAAAGPPEAAAGFDGTTIRLGVLTPQTGLASLIGIPLTAGNQVYFDQLNDAGGVAGQYQVELVLEDTEYVADIAVQAYNKTKGDVVMYTQVLGTDVTNAVLPQMKRDRKVASPATLDAEWVLEETLLPVASPYQVQMMNGADWYFTEGGGEGQTACAIIQNDGYGEAGLEGVEAAAEAQGFEVATVARYELGAPDMTAQIQQLIDNNCEVVFATTLASDTSKVFGKAAELGFAATWLLQTPGWLGQFVGTGLVDYLEANVFVLSQGGPAWGDTSVPGMANMLSAIEQYKPDQGPDFYFAFGYLQAQTVHALLEKAVELGDLSEDGILAALEQLGTVSYDGLMSEYVYGPVGERNPPRDTSINAVDRAGPWGWSQVVANYESDTAAEYEFG